MIRILFVILLSWSVGFPLLAQRKIKPRQLQKHQSLKAESKLRKRTVWSLDTIFQNGQAYAILREKKNIPYSYFTVYSLSNELLISISTQGNEQQGLYYRFQFAESGEWGILEREPGRQRLYKILWKLQLIGGDQVDAFSEMEFLMTHPGSVAKRGSPGGPNQVSNGDIYSTTIRNREAQILIRNGQILQDYARIGNYKQFDDVLRVYLPNGIMVAELRNLPGSGSKQSISTMRDRLVHQIDAREEEPIAKAIRFLCVNGYL